MESWAATCLHREREIIIIINLATPGPSALSNTRVRLSSATAAVGVSSDDRASLVVGRQERRAQEGILIYYSPRIRRTVEG
jgi:hypothetical protein